MKVKLLTSRVLSTGQTQEVGDVIDVEPAEGKRLIQAGQALPLEPAGKKNPPNQER